MSSFINRFGGNYNTMRHSGLSSLQRALGSGMTINAIRDLTAREGVTFGSRAQDFLNARPSNLFISQYGGDAQGMRNSGLASIKRALDDGLTLNEVRSRASNEGITFGSRGVQFLADRAPDKFISKYGGNEETFANSGMASLNRALADGLTPQDIEQMGRDQGITWGTAAQSYLNNARTNRERVQGLQNSLSGLQQANTDLANQYSDLETNMNDQLTNLNQQLTRAQNSYNTPRNVTTSNNLGGFSAGSQGTPMSIRQQGTSRFNRNRRNTLQISNLNV